MKKLINCLAVLIFILSAFGTNTYAANTDEYLLQSINALAAFGIIEEDPIDIDTEEELTRQEAAVWLSNALKLEGEYETSIFSDVSVGTKGANAILSLYDRNIISGFSGGKFRPTETISYTDFAVMLVRILNYEEEADYQGGYPSGYIKQAEDLGLNKRVNKSATKKLTIGDGAKILYNALDKDIKGFGGKFLEQYMDIYKVKGRVTADSKTSLTSADGASAGKIKIGDVFYECTISAEEWLGKDVVAYVMESGGRETLVHLEGGRKYDEITLDASSILRERSNRTTLVYNENDNLKNIRITPVADIIYNGKAYPDATAEEIIPRYGEIRLLDSDNNGEYDVLFVTSYEVMVVENVIAYSGTIYNRLKGTDILASITVSDDADTDIKDSFGERLSFSDIALNNILLVAKSKTGSNPYYKIIVSDNIKNGVFESKDDEYIKVDGTEYIFADVIAKATESGNLAQLKIKAEYNFYFDSYGNIVYYESIYTGKQYGYLKRTYIDENDMTYYLKIFTSDGIWEKIELRNTVKYDGESYKKEVLVEVVATNIMIRYETDPKGRIKNIETAKRLSSDATELSRQIKNDVFRKAEMRDASKNNKYFSMNKSFENAYFLGNDVKVFLIPTGADATEQDFKCTDSSYFVSEIRYTADVYDVDEYMFTDLIVLEYDSSDPANLKFSNQDYCMMVNKAMEMVVDDEVASYVSGLHKNEEWSYTSSGAGTFQGLKRGDIIRTKYDPSGKLTQYVLVHRYGNEDQKSNSTNFNDSVYLFGDVLAVDYENDRMRIDEGSHLTVRTGSAYITVYEPEEDEVRAGTIRDIENGDYVVLRMRSSLPFEIFVIKQ